MARLITALDIGPKQVRMAALEVNGKQATLRALAEEPVAPEEGPQPAVGRVLTRLGVPVDTVVGLFQLQNTSLRNLQLPFADRKKIDQVLPFELEGVFPFDPEEAVYNYFVLGKKDTGAELLIGAARKELVASRLETYRGTGHEPRNLLLDAFALEAAWRAVATPVEGDTDTTALLHIGPDETLLTLVREDGYRFARAFRIGYRELAARAARRRGIEPAGLELALADGSQPIGDDLLPPIVREVDATLRSTERTSRVRPAHLVVSGAPAGWPGFTDAVGQALRIAAEPLRWDETIRGETDGLLGDYAPLVGAAVQSLKGGGLDLRSGEYVYTRAIQLVKGKLYVTGGFAAALVLLLILSNVVAYVVKNREAEALKEEINATFLEALPNDPIVDPVQQMEVYVRGLREQSEGGSAEGVVDLFKGMSQAIGSDVSFKMNEFHKDAAGIRIKGETDSYEKIEDIKNKLSALPGMKNIRVADSKTTPQGGVVFELAVEGGAR